MSVPVSDWEIRRLLLRAGCDTVMDAWSRYVVPSWAPAPLNSLTSEARFGGVGLAGGMFCNILRPLCAPGPRGSACGPFHAYQVGSEISLGSLQVRSSRRADAGVAMIEDETVPEFAALIDEPREPNAPLESRMSGRLAGPTAGG